MRAHFYSGCDAFEGYRGMIEGDYDFPLGEGMNLGEGKLVFPDGGGWIEMDYAAS